MSVSEMLRSVQSKIHYILMCSLPLRIASGLLLLI